VSKQDRQGVRTPADLERKYQFGKTFAEIIGLATDLRESVDSVESELRDEITQNVTAITRNTEQIVMSALESYSKTSDLEEFEKTVESKLLQMAEQISLNFTSASERITNVDGDIQTVKEYLEKHFVFGVDGLTIKAGEGEDTMELLLDNDVIRFIRNGREFGWWDGINFHTGNIFIGMDEVAQFGNYGFVPYEDSESDGLDLVRVGG
jgi:hypothetical protein